MTIEKGSKAPTSQLTTDDLYWFNEGTHRRLGEKLGAHRRDDGEAPTSRCGRPTPPPSR